MWRKMAWYRETGRYCLYLSLPITVLLSFIWHLQAWRPDWRVAFVFVGFFAAIGLVSPWLRWRRVWRRPEARAILCQMSLWHGTKFLVVSIVTLVLASCLRGAGLWLTYSVWLFHLLFLIYDELCGPIEPENQISFSDDEQLINYLRWWSNNKS